MQNPLIPDPPIDRGKVGKFKNDACKGHSIAQHNMPVIIHF